MSVDGPRIRVDLYNILVPLFGGLEFFDTTVTSVSSTLVIGCSIAASYSRDLFVCLSKQIRLDNHHKMQFRVMKRIIEGTKLVWMQGIERYGCYLYTYYGKYFSVPTNLTSVHFSE